MLTLKQKTKLQLPSITLLSRPMSFSPVASDGDELLSDLDGQFTNQDDQWTLTERPDTAELEQFWDTVVADVRKDPDWISIDE